MRVWTIKCNSNVRGSGRGWHWDQYYEDRRDAGGRGWGGDDWISSNWSLMYLREEVRKGDLVVSYQTDGREINGLTRFESNPYEETKGSGCYSNFDLQRPRDAHRFDSPVRIQQLRKHGCYPVCFEKGKQGTIFPIDSAGFYEMIQVICHLQRDRGKSIKKWLLRNDFDLMTYEESTIIDDVSTDRGGRLRATAEHNKKVEQAAVRAVWDWFNDNGWDVQDRQNDPDHCGFDLLCTKEGEVEQHVEVKGTSESTPRFCISRNEYKNALVDPHFVLSVVTNALSADAEIYDYSAAAMFDTFSFEPLSYQATQKGIAE